MLNSTPWSWSGPNTQRTYGLISDALPIPSSSSFTDCTGRTSDRFTSIVTKHSLGRKSYSWVVNRSHTGSAYGLSCVFAYYSVRKSIVYNLVQHTRMVFLPCDWTCGSVDLMVWRRTYCIHDRGIVQRGKQSLYDVLRRERMRLFDWVCRVCRVCLVVVRADDVECT